MPTPAPLTTSSVLTLRAALVGASDYRSLADALVAAGFGPATSEPWRMALPRLANASSGAWGLTWLGARVRSAKDQTLVEALRDPFTAREMARAYHGTEHHLLASLKQVLGPPVHEVLQLQVFDAALRAVERRRSIPRVEAGAAVWEDWLPSFGLQALLDVPAGDLIDVASNAETSRWLEHRADWSVRQALDARIYSGSRAWSRSASTVPFGARDDLRSCLVRAVIEDALAADQPPLADPLSPTAWPKLGAAALDARRQLEEQGKRFGRAWALSVVPGRFEIRTGPPRVTWREDVARWEAPGPPVTIRLDPGVELRSPSGDELPYRVRRTVLLDLCRLLRPSAEHEVLLRRLEEDLALRPVDRLLAALVPAPTERSAELGWALRSDKDGLWLTPVWCEERAGGGSKTRLVKAADLPELLHRTEDPADVEALAALMGSDVGMEERGDSEQRRRMHHPVAIGRALAALTAHPRLFLQTGAERPLRLRREALHLHVGRTDDGSVELRPRLAARPLTPHEQRALTAHPWFGVPAVLLDEDAAVATLVDVTPKQRDVLRALAQHGERFAPDAEDDLVAALPSVQDAMPLELDVALAGERIEGDERLVARLELVAGGVALTLWLRPMAEAPIQVPGRGVGACYGSRDGERVHALRDLDRERRLAAGLAIDLGLRPPSEEAARLQWVVEEGEDAASVLAGLRERPDVAVEWQGPRGRIRQSGGFDRLSLRFKSLGAWFGLQGSLDLEGEDVDLEQLLLAIEQGRRFVRLGDGDWLELDAALRAGLEAAAGGLRGGLDGKLSPLHGPVLDTLREGGAHVDAPSTWWDNLAAIDAAATLQPEVPPGLTADLRPYQRDGFAWMARLAEWAGGAVLADDMGLGKTVQALALLLRRADGPALVVGPASVGWNWVREAERFAPSLRVREYRGADRAALLEDLGPGGVLVTSWDLLARDADALSAVAWSTAVFDEAQAMKNPATRRHKAARRIDAGFRLVLTGTPAENHAGELHAMMQVVLPGLLGSREQFRQRFLGPMQTGNDAARRSLARLISPFVLRRLKSQVALELPERTDVVRAVDLSPSERRIYERVRQAGLASLAVAEETGDAQQRMQVLALLTRLRLAACHPRLAEPSTTAQGSKTAEVLDLLDALRDEGHAVLVFSQFVKHLEIVRDALQERGFRLGWLTGATPTARRQEAVERFQNRELDAFLISIKAGGTGLNLTAATYVVHLDPWWNPAVEDQATDRAHRIGQTERVTVYRFVARDTVEEQILEMHAQKRELVEGLLEGTGSAGAITTDELVALLSAS